jgi:predicted RNase H-like nuclease (RuvC/YqgF family)
MQELIIWTLTILFLGVSALMALRAHRKAESVATEYERLRDAFSEVDKGQSELDAIVEEYRELQSTYAEQKHQLESNLRVISQYEIGIGTTDDSLVQLTHGTGDIEELESQLTSVKDSVKAMVKAKQACICYMGSDILINGRKAGVKTLFNREVRLRLRCFDNEVKAAIALANWNNIGRLNERVRRAFEEINARGHLVKTFIETEYLELRLKELNLSFEIAELKALKKEEEREERRIQREAEREEQKIKAAAENAKKDRERMEVLVAKELAKLDTMNDAQRQELEMHQQELEELKRREQRALSMAQQTRAGFVYVISNPNSFGNDVIKIGMTRRADPYERVRELGDASVPDTFDVHGFFYCEDAPQLESDIHKVFDEKRVNLVNKRKEFFYVNAEQALEQIASHEIETLEMELP